MVPPPIPPEEITELMQWLAEKVKNVKSQLTIAELARQFKKETGSLLTVDAVNTRINKYRHRIHEMDEFNTETKMKMIFALSVPIDKGFLLELKKIADIDIDGGGRITKYKAKDGSLELEGDHSMSAKMKAACAKKKKRRGFDAYSDSEEDIDYEFDNQSEMSTKRKRARISSPSSEIDEDENPKGEGPSTSTPLSISLLEFLNRLRRPAIKLNIPFVANKIDREIEILEKKDDQIPINTIIESLEEFIQILENPDEMDSDNETISLSDYLYHLGLSMCYIAHPLMNDFQKKLRKLVAAEDQQIPLEHIRYATEKALEKINR